MRTIVKHVCFHAFQVLAFILMASPALATSLLYEDLNRAFLQSAHATASMQNVVHKGNGPQAQIPKIPRIAQTRAVLGGDLMTLLNIGQETELAIALGQAKIPQILKALDEQGLVDEAIKLAEVFEIHPLHILGPIIGENSFNGAIDKTIQEKSCENKLKLLKNKTK